jgi:hypothetical protein
MSPRHSYSQIESVSNSLLSLSADDNGGTIALDEPAVRARCIGANLAIGERIAVTLQVADQATHNVTFAAS